MSPEEKRAWVMAITTFAAYVIYLSIILRRADDTGLAATPYAATLVWTIVITIVAQIVLSIAAAITSGKDANKKDARDREIGRFGEYIGQSFVIIGAVSAMLLAMAKQPYFWIANAVYLGFVLSALVGSVAKIVAYRRGVPRW